MTNILVGDFVLLLLVFIRIISAFLAAPIFSDESIPDIAKIFLAFVISYIIFLTIKTSTAGFLVVISKCCQGDCYRVSSWIFS